MERFGIIVLLALCLAGCAKQDNARYERPALRVRTLVVTPQQQTASSRYVGSIEAIREVPLSLHMNSRIEAVYVHNGERVRAGQVLMLLDSTQAKNAVLSTQASLHRAQDAHARVKQVHEKGVVTDQKMVEVESQLAQAQAMYEAALQQLKECSLVAPCAGVVSGLDVEKGQHIIPGRTLCSLLDVSAYRVVFTVPEAEIGGVGEHGQVTCPAIDASFPITVTEKSPSANTLTHTYDVAARVQGGTEALLPGMVAVVQMQPSAQDAPSESIVLPARCVLMKTEGPTVWVVNQGQVTRRAITVDGYLADGVKVSSGLQAGDTVVTEGYQKLYNGCNVICDVQ